MKPKPILHPDDFPNLNRKNRRALLKKLLRKQKGLVHRQVQVGIGQWASSFALASKALNKLNDTVGQELLKGITKGRNAFRVKDVCKAEEDDDGNLTGRYFLKCVSKQKRPVLDSKGQIIPDDLLRKIGSGSKGRAILSIKKSVASQHKTVGITMYLDKVQVVSVVEYTGGNGGSGFDTVDGGFTADVHPAIDASGVNF